VDGDDAVSDFELYRYTHADGTAKEWAWHEEPGVGIEVRWGRSGRLVQKTSYPPSQRRTVIERALAKQRKGYRFVGWCRIDPSGRPVDLREPDGPPRERAPQPAPPRPASTPLVPGIDLSQVETGREDYWF
jgi:hypothetical protein